MKCRWCGRGFERVQNKKARPRFCSSRCYGLWQRGKTFSQQDKPTRPVRQCEMPDCSAVHFGRGLCRRHYLVTFYPVPPMPRPVELKCLNCGVAYLAPHFRKDVSRFCSRPCSSRFNRSGKIIKKGYRKVLKPSHHRADGKGYVFEHIVVAEETIGRAILRGEEVHHIDGNRLNNAPSNLEVCPDRKSHMLKHGRCA